MIIIMIIYLCAYIFYALNLVFHVYLFFSFTTTTIPDETEAYYPARFWKKTLKRISSLLLICCQGQQGLSQTVRPAASASPPPSLFSPPSPRCYWKGRSGKSISGSCGVFCGCARACGSERVSERGERAAGWRRFLMHQVLWPVGPLLLSQCAFPNRAPGAFLFRCRDRGRTPSIQPTWGRWKEGWNASNTFCSCSTSYSG